MIMIKKHYSRIITFLLLLLLGNIFLSSQVASRDVRVSQMQILISAPYPIYLSDYISDITKKLQIGIYFSDNDNKTWDVQLKIKLYCASFGISTKQDFIPLKPITLTAGVFKWVSGSELYEYFDFNNLDISGISKEQFEQSGGMLPEGTYTLKVEVYNYYRRPDLLINDPEISKKYFDISLYEAPTLIVPLQESIINPTTIQNITFQWQLPFADLLTTRYKLHIYEITDPYADPKNAIEDGSALSIFTSEEVNINTYQYSISKPLLEEGKKYAYRVEATNTDKKPVFKNNGFSETRWFYYGYPKNGKIQIESPVDKYAFSLREDRMFSWSAPDNLLKNQQYSYELKIVELNDGDVPSDAIDFNSPYYTYKSTILSGSLGYENLVSQQFSPLKQFAWQVKAYSDSHEIAKSDVNTFYGPPPIEAFKAGNHVVELVRASSTDMDNLSGVGKISISDSEKIEMNFENIRLAKTGGEWVMQEGELTADMKKHPPIILHPEYEANGEAKFIPDELLLTKDMLSFHGVVQWNLPYPTISSDIPLVESVPVFFNYNEFTLLGVAQVSEKTREFDLLDPLGFTIDLSEKSNFLVRGKNNFVIRFGGEIMLPNSIRSTSGKRSFIPFNENQLFWIQGTNPNLEILPVRNTGIILKPTSYVIDFSETESPFKFKNNPEWKGCYFGDFETDYNKLLDSTRQLRLTDKIVYNTNQNKNDSVKFWITSTGLDYQYMYKFTDSINSTFNTFPSVLNNLDIQVEKGRVINKFEKGSIKIPFINETDEYPYTIEISDLGFKPGDLDKSLAGLEFAFNPDGGDQKINLKIERAVFADNERMDMTLDVDWPGLNFKLESVDNFKAWGNLKIGFGKPNGTTPLTHQQSGSIKSFPITIENIGAGSTDGLYAFGVSTIIIMSEDATGPDGPTRSNIYSLVENKFLGEYVPVTTETDNNEQVNSTSEDSSSIPLSQTITNLDLNNLPENYSPEKLENDINKKVAESKKNTLDKITNENSLSQNNFTQNDSLSHTSGSKTEGDKWTYGDTTKYTNGNTEVAFVSFVSVDYSSEKLWAAIDTLVKLLPKEQKEEAVKVKAGIKSLEQRYQVDIFKEITDINKLFNKILKKEYDRLISDLLKPIDDKTNDAKKLVTATVKSFTDIANKSVSDAVGASINTISEAIQGMTDKDDIKQVINNIADSTKVIIVNEINKRINGFVKEQVTDPINDQILGKISKIVQDSLRAQLTTFGYRIIDNGGNANLNDVIDVNRILGSINDQVISKLFDFNEIQKGIDGAKDAFFNKYFNPSDIYDTLFDQLAKKGLDYLAKQIEDSVSKAIVKGVTDAFGKGAGGFADTLLDNLGDNVKLDFSDLGEKIKDGRLDKIIVFDPTKISIKTSIVDVVGSVKFINDSIEGNVFKGNFDVLVKVPTKFKVSAKYISGKRGDLDYWYVGVGYDARDDASKDKNKKAEPLSEVIPLGIINITAISGKLYHHMSVTDESEKPDASIDYGAGLTLALNDGITNGSYVKLDVAASVTVKTDGNFNIDFKGNIDICSSTAKGTISLSYDSKEQHFLGVGSINITTSVLCADGTVTVDLKPGDFLIGIGSKEKKIIFVPACAGWSPTGWLIITQRDFDLGLGLSFSGYAQSPSINICGIDFAAYAGFGVAAGIEVAVIYAPSLKLEKAGVWLQAWASVGLIIGDSKVEILSATLTGNSYVIFDPPPTTATGDFNVTLTVLGIFQVGFGMNYSMTL